MDATANIDINSKKINKICPGIIFDTIFSFFVIQYFAESINNLRNFILLCKRFTTKDSEIVLVFPDGESIFKLLKGTPIWSYSIDGNIICSIKKLYRDSKLTDAGQKISVKLPFSQNELYEEYLLNSTNLIDMFKDEGFKLIKTEKPICNLNAFEINNKQKFSQLTEEDKIWIGLFKLLVFKRMM